MSNTKELLRLLKQKRKSLIELHGKRSYIDLEVKEAINYFRYNLIRETLGKKPDASLYSKTKNKIVFNYIGTINPQWFYLKDILYRKIFIANQNFGQIIIHYKSIEDEYEQLENYVYFNEGEILFENDKGFKKVLK